MWKDAKLLLFFLAALGPRGFVRAFSGVPLPCRALRGRLPCGCGAEALEGGLSCDGEAELHPPSPACTWNLCESGYNPVPSIGRQTPIRCAARQTRRLLS